MSCNSIKINTSSLQLKLNESLSTKEKLCDIYVLISWKNKQSFFTTDFLSCHTGITNNINVGSISHDSVTSASMHNTTTLKQLNGIQPLLFLLFTPVIFVLWHVKMSSMKQALSGFS